jgi:hypothetical protein
MTVQKYNFILLTIANIARIYSSIVTVFYVVHLLFTEFIQTEKSHYRTLKIMQKVAQWLFLV